VVHRYKLAGLDEEAEYIAALEAYRFKYYPGVRAAAAASALACYDYQASECDDHQTTAAAFFVKQLDDLLGSPDTENEPWGYEDEQAVLAAIDSEDKASPASLKTALENLLRELDQLDCSCTVRERCSGHRTDCNMPSVREAQQKSRALISIDGGAQ
jgi:hypothetical protein